MGKKHEPQTRAWEAALCFPARKSPGLQEMSSFHNAHGHPKWPQPGGSQTLRIPMGHLGPSKATMGPRTLLPAWLSSRCTRRWPSPGEPVGPVQLAQGHQQLGKQWAVGPAVARAGTKAWALPLIEGPSFMVCQGKGRGSFHRDVGMFCKGSSGRAVATSANRGAGERGALTQARGPPPPTLLNRYNAGY